MKAVERAARAELGALPAELRAWTLAKVALNLARRLDSGPSDREATLALWAWTNRPPERKLWVAWA